MILIGSFQQNTHYIEQAVDDDRAVRLHFGDLGGGRTIELLPGGGFRSQHLAMSAEAYHALVSLILMDRHPPPKRGKLSLFFNIEHEAIE